MIRPCIISTYLLNTLDVDQAKMIINLTLEKFYKKNESILKHYVQSFVFMLHGVQKPLKRGGSIKSYE